MKILLTGGAGFIGSHTTEWLLDRGDDVVVVDSVSAYYDPAIKRGCLAILKEFARTSPGKLTIYHDDVTNKERLRSIFEMERPEVVCHLAAQVGVRYSIEHSDETVAINIVGTTNIFECCSDFGIKNIVAASCSSVYGDTSKAPFSEDQACDKATSPYAATKRTCEMLAYTFHHLYQLNITMLRIFSAYGPRGRPDMAVFKFIDRIQKGQAVDRYGDGFTTRDFAYIDDVVNGVIGALDTVSPFEVVNLGGGSSHTLNELIETIERHVGRQAVINPLPTQPGEPSLASACLKKARRVLGFCPQVGLDEGICRTVEWYQDTYLDAAAESDIAGQVAGTKISRDQSTSEMLGLAGA